MPLFPKYFKYLLLVPVIHVLAQVTTNFFPYGTINPGALRVFYLVLLVSWFFAKFKVPLKGFFLLIFTFLIYNLILVLLNNDLYRPVFNLIKLSLSFFMFFVGYKLVNNHLKLIALFKSYQIASIFFILNYILANVFNLGSSAYLEDSFHLGGSGVGLTNDIALFTIISIGFLMIQRNKTKWRTFTILIIVANFMVLLLAMRRGAFLTLGGALFIFLLFSNVKLKITKYLILASIILFILSPIYLETVIDRYNYRVESRKGSLANYEIEGRFLELTEVPNSLSKENAWLFGTHNLNSETYFGGRSLHVGYMSILHGSGLIGLSLFFIIIYILYKKVRSSYKLIKKIEHTNDLKVFYSLYLSLIVALLLYLLTSRLHGFTLVFPAFLFLGSLLRYFHYRTSLHQKNL